ncbi:MAG: ROK family protein [bacterium]|nr:ROK family protein [bacterium]
MFIGVDIGGTKIRVAGSRLGRQIDYSIKIATPINQHGAIGLISQAIEKVCKISQIDAIGISAPGPLDIENGMILKPNNLTWRNLELVTPLKKRFNCPIILEHDAACGAIAEARTGAGKNHRNMLYITISTGIGTCFTVDGVPIKGRFNSEGGKQIIDYDHHVRHQELGSFEYIVSGKAIKRRFGKIAAEIDDPATWQLIAYDLSVGIYNLITITSPDIVVLGGGVSVHFEHFERYLNENLKRYPAFYPLPMVVQAKYVETAPTLGAIMLASQES